METIRTDLAKLTVKTTMAESTPKTPKTPIPKKTAASNQKIDLASNEMATWFENKFVSTMETPKFIGKVKQLAGEKLVSHQISTSNISPAAQGSITKWSTDAVSNEIETIISSNTAAIVRILKPHMTSTSSESNVDATFKEGIQKALSLLQEQLNGQKMELDNLERVSTSADKLMSIILVKDIFADFKLAAKKVLENLKVWSHLSPSKSTDITSAAQNVLDFQKSKGKCCYKCIKTKVLTEISFKAFSP